MNILVFGASGKTGRVFIDQALARGNSVTAFVRDPAKLTLQHDSLQVVTGDIGVSDSLDPAFVNGIDAVVSTLGIYDSKPRTELSEGTRNILAAMDRHGVRRCLFLTSLGVGDSNGQGNFVARNWAKYMLKEVLKDKERQEAYIHGSGCDWTIVRPPQLIDRDQARDIIAWEGPSPEGARLTWRTARTSVANFLLDLLDQDGHVRSAVNISEPK
jgi:uncharacterized protein YbjT (DUF2867 family)